MSKMFYIIILFVALSNDVLSAEKESVIRTLISAFASIEGCSPRDLSPAQKFENALKQNKIEREMAIPVLVEYAQGGYPPDQMSIEKRLADFSLGRLVAWGRKEETLPLLLSRFHKLTNVVDKVAQNDKERFYQTDYLNTVVMIIQLGGNDSLDVAKLVLNDKRPANYPVRFEVYRTLSGYVLNTNYSDKAFINKCVQLFENGLNTNERPENVEVIDKTFSAIKKGYRTSSIRENIVSHFAKIGNFPYQQKYFQSESKIFVFEKDAKRRGQGVSPEGRVAQIPRLMEIF